MNVETSATALISRYGFIEVQGPDAAAFLQSQLSADTSALIGEQSVLTGWHDPKGRVQCCLKVLARESGFLLVLPASMVGDIRAGLSRYVLRAKVILTDASDRLTTAAVIDGQDERFEVYAAIDELTARVADHHKHGVRILSDTEWELGDIRAGLPEVYPATAGMFTGQMLNLDLIGGISFTKGCFPGQEIIARTHYLGRVKRRMQRYVSTAPPRQPGESLYVDDRSAGQVVRSAATDCGSETLVVAAVETPGLLTAEDGASLTPASLPYNLF